jgi:hypothetical protein
MPTSATITTKTIHVGVAGFARESSDSQPYVSKWLARGYPADAAAIANAFFDATGVRMQEFPLTPARVLAALKRG